jgi:hypothetical protein
MSDHVVAEFFKKESLLEVSLGSDGMLGFFAENYPTIIAMSRSIYDQEELTRERKHHSVLELREKREELSDLDSDLSSHGFLSDPDQASYSQLKLEIEFHEKELEREDDIFFRGDALRMCPEYEFISKVDLNFPGLMFAMTEFDRLLRIPISGLVSRGLGWLTAPLRFVVGTIVQHSNLGIAGQLIYMLVDQYPQLIESRMQAEKPTGRPPDYPQHEVDGYGIKEIKYESVTKWKNHQKDQDDK